MTVDAAAIAEEVVVDVKARADRPAIGDPFLDGRRIIRQVLVSGDLDGAVSPVGADAAAVCAGVVREASLVGRALSLVGVKGVSRPPASAAACSRGRSMTEEELR